MTVQRPNAHVRVPTLRNFSWAEVPNERDQRPHFGVDRHEPLNVLSAGELTARSQLEYARCGRLFCSSGRSQQHLHDTGHHHRPTARIAREIIVCILICMVLTLSMIAAVPAFGVSGPSAASLGSSSARAAPDFASRVLQVSAVSQKAGPGNVAPSDPLVRRNSTTPERITQLEAATRATPTAGEQWRQLGAAYIRRSLETADPAFYNLADSSLRRAEKILGASPEVLVTKAALALARHRFGEAEDFAARAVRSRPEALDGRLALFDAEVELGKYDSAFRSIEALVAQRPNVATLSRLSYRLQLSGDLRGAEIAMRQATSAAPPNSIDRAIALGYLGDVLLEGGRVDAASKSYAQAIRLDPPNGTATLGQARVALARGDIQTAVSLLDRLVDRNPIPGALGLRADIARSRNDTKMATSLDGLVDASIALFQFNGAVVDSELAILLADRGRGSAPAAVVAAKRAYAERRTIFTNDAMAWSLFADGRSSEALPYARAAVAMSPAVSSVRWHAAEVFAATGDKASARTEVVAAMRNPWSTPAQLRGLQVLAARLGVAPAGQVPPVQPQPTRLLRGV